MPSSPTLTSYSYDPIGNILLRGPTTITYDPSRPHQVQTAGTSSYAYNLDGNVASRSGPEVPSGAQTFSYTPFDLPSSITTGATETLFEYTADEERVVRRDPEQTRYSLGDLYERLTDTASGETLEERFRIYAGDRQIAEVVRTAQGDSTLYLHTDAIGTVETVSDGQQNHYQQSFDPLGTPLRRQGSTAVAGSGPGGGQWRDNPIGKWECPDTSRGGGADQRRGVTLYGLTSLTRLRILTISHTSIIRPAGASRAQ